MPDYYDRYQQQQREDEARAKAEAEGRVFVERRKRKDWMTKAITIFSVFAWIAAFAILSFLDMARPQQGNFLSWLFAAPVRSSWNASMLRIAFAILLAVFLVCVVGFLFNLFRSRRKSDRYNKSLIILGVLSLIGIVIFLWKFATIL